MLSVLTDAEKIQSVCQPDSCFPTKDYDVTNSYSDADMVIVNTCGFIDSAVQESLDTIGEALTENGKVLGPGCLGAKKD